MLFADSERASKNFLSYFDPEKERDLNRVEKCNKIAFLCINYFKDGMQQNIDFRMRKYHCWTDLIYFFHCILFLHSYNTDMFLNHKGTYLQGLL